MGRAAAVGVVLSGVPAFFAGFIGFWAIYLAVLAYGWPIFVPLGLMGLTWFILRSVLEVRWAFSLTLLFTVLGVVAFVIFLVVTGLPPVEYN